MIRVIELVIGWSLVCVAIAGLALQIRHDQELITQANRLIVQLSF